MAQTVGNVTAGKPDTGGAVWRAAKGTAAPTNASSALADAFKALGYISEDGMTNSNSPSTTDIKAWGGDVVASLQDEKPDEFKCTFIEALNVEVLKAIYGGANVTGSLEESTLKVEATSDEQEEAVWVCDMILNGGIKKRIVIPHGRISEIGEVVYKDNEVTGYEVTIKALPDTNGKTHYEHYAQPSSNQQHS